jgi:hypothetical protein
MGAYYYYINDTKECYFSIDPLTGSEIKRRFVCNSVGGVGFGFLLWSDPPEHSGINTHPLLGSWVGDKIHIASDDHSELFDPSTTPYRDIAASVTEMLVVIAPFHVIEYAGTEWVEEWIRQQNDNCTFAQDLRMQVLDDLELQYASYPNDELKSLIDALTAG